MTVPDGWRLVPVEPTRAMLDAVSAAFAHRTLDTYYDEQMARVYRAMIEAAPAVSPPEIEGG